jgi:hypothetical protein
MKGLESPVAGAAAGSSDGKVRDEMGAAFLDSRADGSDTGTWTGGEGSDAACAASRLLATKGA